MSSLRESLLNLKPFSKSPTQAKEEQRQAFRLLAQNNLYFLCKVVLGMRDLSVGFHGPLTLELDSLQRPYGRRLDLWPRGHLKTHIITIGKSIQYYLKDHNVRILLAGSSLPNAIKNLRKIKQIFEGNTFLHWLFPECIPNTARDKWAETEIVLPRTVQHPEGTFKAIGVGGHITGWHFDVLMKDDLIDEKTEKSPEMMEKIIDWHLLTKNLLESPTTGIDQLIGTRWLIGDLYGYIIDREPEYICRTISALKRSGDSAWPERFQKEALLSMRERDPYNFACQQMNNPRDAAITDFDARWLRYFTFGSNSLLIERAA